MKGRLKMLQGIWFYTKDILKNAELWEQKNILGSEGGG